MEAARISSIPCEKGANTSPSFDRCPCLLSRCTLFPLQVTLCEVPFSFMPFQVKNGNQGGAVPKSPSAMQMKRISQICANHTMGWPQMAQWSPGQLTNWSDPNRFQWSVLHVSLKWVVCSHAVKLTPLPFIHLGYPGQDFDWADYLKQCGAEAAPQSCFPSVRFSCRQMSLLLCEWHCWFQGKEPFACFWLKLPVITEETEELRKCKYMWTVVGACQLPR